MCMVTDGNWTYCNHFVVGEILNDVHLKPIESSMSILLQLKKYGKEINIKQENTNKSFHQSH